MVFSLRDSAKDGCSTAAQMWHGAARRQNGDRWRQNGSGSGVGCAAGLHGPPGRGEVRDWRARRTTQDQRVRRAQRSSRSPNPNLDWNASFPAAYALQFAPTSGDQLCYLAAHYDPIRQCRSEPGGSNSVPRFTANSLRILYVLRKPGVNYCAPTLCCKPLQNKKGRKVPAAPLAPDCLWLALLTLGCAQALRPRFAPVHTGPGFHPAYLRSPNRPISAW